MLKLRMPKRGVGPGWKEKLNARPKHPRMRCSNTSSAPCSCGKVFLPGWHHPLADHLEYWFGTQKPGMIAALTEVTNDEIPTPIEALIVDYLPIPTFTECNCVCYVCQVTTRLSDRYREKENERDRAPRKRHRVTACGQ
jgi:hypothetical protein